MVLGQEVTMISATPVARGTEPVPDTARAAHGVRVMLGWFAVAVVVGMQAGTVFKPLGSVGETRVADWVDLLTPYAVLGTAAAVLARAGATHRQWILFGAGGVTFALGKGLHISANSVSNVEDALVAKASIVHLWDEVAAHLVWYSGLFLVLLAIASTLREVSLPFGAPEVLGTALVALTLANTYIEGAQPVLGSVFLTVLLVLGIAWRPAPVSRLLRAVGALGLLLVLGWGLVWYLVDGSVFPEFSELGWI
jgi:hypothetical protein